MIVRTGPAVVFRYKVTASLRVPWRVDTRLPGDVSTISPTDCIDGSGVWRTVTMSKATNQRRSQSGAADVRAGHDTTTVGANAAWHPIADAMMSAPVSAEDQMPRSVSGALAMAGSLAEAFSDGSEGACGARGSLGRGADKSKRQCIRRAA